MTPVSWPCPLPGGGIADEYALAFDKKREHRLLIVPALFEEANRLRRLTVEVMRRLDGAGIDCFLADLPGTNESLQPLEVQSCEDWRDAMGAAARHFGATHSLGMRGGCLFTPANAPSWHYAPVKGAMQLRQMVRARIIASREAGREEKSDDLMELALREGLELSGYRLGAEFLSEFQSRVAASGPDIHVAGQDMVGGSGLWLRAEPGDSAEQADALAAILSIGIRS